MTDTTTQAVERPCPNCGVTLNGHSGIRSYGTYFTHDIAYCLRYLRDQLDAANARADSAESQLISTCQREAALISRNDVKVEGLEEQVAHARDAALVEAADIILADNYDDPDSAANAILALRNKPAPAMPLADLDQHSRDAWAKAAEGAPPPTSLPIMSHGRVRTIGPNLRKGMEMADKGTKAKTAERYERAAHRVQTAIAFNPDRPRDQYKDLRTGLDMRAADAAGLATLLIEKGVFTMDEYLTAVADAAEREADQKEDELSIRHGIKVRTV